MGLVLGIDLAAKSFALSIEHDRDITILIGLYEAANHIDDSLHCSRRLALAAHERRQGMKCTKQVRGSIYKNELFGFGQLTFLLHVWFYAVSIRRDIDKNRLLDY